METQKILNLTNACSYSHTPGGKKCMSDAIIQKIKAKSNNIEFNNNLDKLLASKGCTIDELGFLLDKRTIGIIGEKAIIDEIQTNFKPIGPVNNELFNNYVIDNAIVNQVARLDPTFLGVDVNLMDFPDYMGSLTKLKPTPGGITCGSDDGEYKHFGCVLNTLLSSGNLKKVGHWVAMYGDFRNDRLNTIEYFNSSGNNPPKRVEEWMNAFAEECSRVRGVRCISLVASNIRHQKSETECGIYAMYYIVARFIGVGYKKFREAVIPDEYVNRFRSKMFNDQKKVNISLLEKHRLM